MRSVVSEWLDVRVAIGGIRRPIRPSASCCVQQQSSQQFQQQRTVPLNAG